MTHECVSELTMIGAENGIGRSQAIIWTNDRVFQIGPLGTKFGQIVFEIQTFFQENAFENVVCEMAAILSPPQCVIKPR